jgi:hypothetical protein
VCVVDARIRRARSDAVKIIDARSGEVMTPGKIVVYGGGEKLRVIDVDQRLFTARALIETTSHDYSRIEHRPSDQGAIRDREPLVTTQQWVQLTVRFMHPDYMFERIAIIPS